MKKILLIHTGGTISMLENKETGEVNSTNDHPLENVVTQFHTDILIDEHIEFSLPSPQITPNHMLLLANKISNVIHNYDGIIVTHGTDTLEESAFFLDLVLTTEKPIILTGAMRSANEIGSDALYNLYSSIRVAISNDAYSKGVLVVMNDEIHTAENVTKTSTSNIATFQSPQYGPIGIITKDTVIFHHDILYKPLHPLHPVKSISKDVYLLKAYAGMDEKIFEAIRNLKPDGLVVEGLGQGNLPKETLSPISKFIKDKIPVVLVSRCYQGIVQPTYGYDGGGRQLKNMGVIFTNGLTGPKARIKLLIALEKKHNIESLRRVFEGS